MMMAGRYISLLLFCLLSGAYSEGEVEAALKLQNEIKKCLKESNELTSTLTNTLKVTNFESWLLQIQDLKLKDQVEQLKRHYSDLQFRLNKTSDLILKLASEWSDKDVRKTANRIEQFKQKTDVVNSKLTGSKDHIGSLQKDYKNLDILVRAHESQYPDFVHRISELEKKSGVIEDETKSHGQKCEELQEMMQVNKLEVGRISVEADMRTGKNKRLDETIKQLEADIKALKERGLHQPDDIIAIDQARGKGKSMNFKLVT